MHSGPDPSDLQKTADSKKPQVPPDLESAQFSDAKLENPAKKERYYLLFEKIRVSQTEAEAHYRLFKHLHHNDSLGFLYVAHDCLERTGRFTANNDTARFLIEQGVGFANKTGYFELNDKARALGKVMIKGRTGVDRELHWPVEFGKIPD